MRAIEPSLVVSSVRHQWSTSKQKYKELLAALRTSGANAEIFPTRQEFDWALGVLNSRRIWWDNGGHLTPLLDLINCKSELPIHSTVGNKKTKSALTYARHAFKYEIDQQRKNNFVFLIFKNRKGEQVFENYGQANYIYFLFHGFSIDRNVEDCVLIKFSGEREACVDRNLQIKSAHMHGSHSRKDLLSAVRSHLTRYRTLEQFDNELSLLASQPYSLHNSRMQVSLLLYFILFDF